MSAEHHLHFKVDAVRNLFFRFIKIRMEFAYLFRSPLICIVFSVLGRCRVNKRQRGREIASHSVGVIRRAAGSLAARRQNGRGSDPLSLRPWLKLLSNSAGEAAGPEPEPQSSATQTQCLEWVQSGFFLGDLKAFHLSIKTLFFRSQNGTKGVR